MVSTPDRPPPAPSLPDFKLAEKLGQGAFGCVYKALNWSTGETCAVKQIDLSHIPESELPDIMSEIDLLKNLHHPNVVQYRGYARTATSLYIILEYCENGSLSAIIKKFGRIPESLVGLYTLQVLQGLQYLHDQGVMHRDIKGSNILATKEGSIKLADFGVATRVGGPLDSSVVGSPYWMAPEVVDQSGASPASDIWSLGALVVELLTGKPPYHFLDPMPALFRIVNDDSPPLPCGASAAVRDFLVQCFQKDPNLRVGARKLLRHPWMMAAKRQADAQAAEIAARGAATRSSRNSCGRGEVGPGAKATGTQGKSQPINSIYEDEVRVVKEWNEALRAAPVAPRNTYKPPGTRLPLRPRAGPVPVSATLPSSGSGLAGELVSALKKPSTAGLTSELSSAPPAAVVKSNEGDGSAGGDSDNWDSDFEESIFVGKLKVLTATPASVSSAGGPPAQEEQGADPEERDIRGQSLTIRPTAATLNHLARTPGERKVNAPLEKIVEDYSDLLGDIRDEDDIFTKRIESFKEKAKNRPQLLRPSDLVSLSPLASPAPSPPQKPIQDHRRTPSVIDMYSEADEDDYEDVLGLSGDSPIDANEGLKLNTRLSSRSWHGDEDSDEDDPFAFHESSFLPVSNTRGVFEYSEADLARDQHARQSVLVTELVDVVSSAILSESKGRYEADRQDIREAALQLAGLLEDSAELRAHFCKCHGMLVFLEALRSARSYEVLSILLRVVNLVVGLDAAALEKLVGGCPVVIGFASRRFPRDIRLEAALFIGAMCRASLLTLQMFISCQGLRTLVELLNEDYTKNKDLIWMAVDGIFRVFETHGPTTRNDFCRILTQESLLDPLSSALIAVCRDSDDLAESAKAKIVPILLLFAQSDHKVKESMARRSILNRLIQAAGVLEPELLSVLLKALKNLSMLPAALDPLQHAGAIDMSVCILGRTYRGRLGAEIQNHAMNALFNLCRLSKVRQAEAAAAGAIPLLQRIVRDNSPLKQFALPILCDFAHAGKPIRKLLWQHQGLSLYLNLLCDAFWVKPALEAILAWLQDEPTRVTAGLLIQSAIDAFVRLFDRTKSTILDSLLEPLHKILRTSATLAARLAVQSGFIKRLIEHLERASVALVRLNLLRIIKAIFDALSHDFRDRDKAVRILVAPVSRLAREDKAVLSRQLAKSLVDDFAATKEEARRLVARRSMRRSLSDSAAMVAGPTLPLDPAVSRSMYRSAMPGGGPEPEAVAPRRIGPGLMRDAG